MSTEIKINLLKEQIANIQKEKIKHFLSLCESEIERLFLLNFINYYESQFAEFIEVVYSFDITDIDSSGSIIFEKKSSFAYNSSGYAVPLHVKVDLHSFHFLLIPQHEIILSNKKYRVDFLIKVIRFDNSEINICIECDGYEFHQKSIDQVNKDNKRDRELLSHGYLIFRYSGSEIYTKSFFFEALMKEIEKIGVRDLVEKERLEVEKFIDEYGKMKNLSLDVIQNLKRNL
jgi:very-short-patch-repair endonuclease